MYSLCYFFHISLLKHFSSFPLFLEHNLNTLPGPPKLNRIWPLPTSVSSSCVSLIPRYLHQHCREGSNLFSPLPHSWLRTPIIKGSSTDKFNNTYMSCTCGRAQENLVTSPKGPSHHLKYHLQLKKKKKKDVGVEASHGGFPAQQVKEGVVAEQMSCLAS